MNQLNKERQANRMNQEKARQAGYTSMERDPPAKTWSATMPPYCYTSLCPDPRYRQ